MILIFGGTTEGRIVARVLDEAGSNYYYSTKGTLQDLVCKHGTRVTGAMNGETMIRFCKDHSIRLLIDAAHPFAIRLHQTIASTAETLGLPVIRYERRYPERDSRLVWCDHFEEAIHWLKEHRISNLLALTGVQTIPHLRPYWQEHPCWFRILRREESVRLAIASGFPEERLLFWQEGEDVDRLFRQIRPDAIITKESGESGFFSEKTRTAIELGIPVLVIKRPTLPESFYTVDGEHGLRYRTERLVPGFFPLRSGLTTGSCATAATLAAFQSLLSHTPRQTVAITLPNGESLTLPVKECFFGPDSCTCSVVKDAGDDPDVTDGCLIVAEVKLSSRPGVHFLPGHGVGIVTLPGLGIPIGEPAINPTPRTMITREVVRLLEQHDLSCALDVRISVPGGETLAQKTFNPRLGITRGISIIGTSGIVRPFSSEAFVLSIRKEIQVAKALGCTHLVINSGAKSEKTLRERFPHLLPQAFVHYGNFIGETLRIAETEGIDRITMGIMIGKAVKLAEGHLDTHSKNAVMNKEFLLSIARESHCPVALFPRIAEITLVRELWQILADHPAFFTCLLRHCYARCTPLLHHSHLEIILIED